jgi:hypothetical protein
VELIWKDDLVQVGQPLPLLKPKVEMVAVVKAAELLLIKQLTLLKIVLQRQLIFLISNKFFLLW